MIDRFEGYKKAIEETKIPLNEDYVEFGCFDNDHMAMGAIEVMRKRRKLKMNRLKCCGVVVGLFIVFCTVLTFLAAFT